jgi:hypothetical protein
MRDGTLDIQYLSARISLVVLAFGFLSLGTLSLALRAKENSARASQLEDRCRYAGSSVSILVGAVFFAAACIYRGK